MNSIIIFILLQAQITMLKEYCEEYLVFHDLVYRRIKNSCYAKTISVIDFHKGLRTRFDSLIISEELFLDNGQANDKEMRDDVFTSARVYSIPGEPKDLVVISGKIFCSIRFSKLSACYQLWRKTAEEDSFSMATCCIETKNTVVMLKGIPDQ